MGKGAPEFIIFHPLVLSIPWSVCNLCERAPADSDPQSSLEMLQKKLRNNSRARLETFLSHSIEDTLARRTQGCQRTPGIRHPDTPGGSTHEAAPGVGSDVLLWGSGWRSLRWHLPLPHPEILGQNLFFTRDDGVATIVLSEVGYFQRGMSLPHSYRCTVTGWEEPQAFMLPPSIPGGFIHLGSRAGGGGKQLRAGGTSGRRCLYRFAVCQEQGRKALCQWLGVFCFHFSPSDEWG